MGYADAAMAKMGPTSVTVNGQIILSTPEYQSFFNYYDNVFPIRIGDIIGVTMSGDAVATKQSTRSGIILRFENDLQFLSE